MILKTINKISGRVYKYNTVKTLSKFIVSELYNEEYDFLPFIEAIKISPHDFTILDILRVIENEKLLRKFGHIERVQDNIERTKESDGLVTDFILYLLGWIPGISPIPESTFDM